MERRREICVSVHREIPASLPFAFLHLTLLKDYILMLFFGGGFARTVCGLLVSLLYYNPSYRERTYTHRIRKAFLQVNHKFNKNRRRGIRVNLFKLMRIVPRAFLQRKGYSQFVYIMESFNNYPVNNLGRYSGI